MNSTFPSGLILFLILQETKGHIRTKEVMQLSQTQGTISSRFTAMHTWNEEGLGALIKDVCYCVPLFNPHSLPWMAGNTYALGDIWCTFLVLAYSSLRRPLVFLRSPVDL
jgi:hypothetical protein